MTQFNKTVQDLILFAESSENLLREKGMLNPDVEVILNYTANTPVKVRVSFYAEIDLISTSFNLKQEKTIEDLLHEVHQYIASLSSIEQIKKEKFLQRFSDVIAEARELDLPIDFINPLEESMRSLSENILEDKSV